MSGTDIADRIRQSLANVTPQAAPQQQQQPAAPSGSEAEPMPEGQDLAASSKTFGDLARAIIGGGRDAIVNAGDTVNRAAFGIAKFGQEHGLAVPGAPDITKEEAGPSPAEVLPEVERADESTTSGAIMNSARDVERFILGFMGAGHVMRGLGLATNTFKGAAAAGAVGDFLVTGPNDSRLVDFFDSFPALKGPVLEALHTDGNDDYWTHKLAAASEGVLVGAAIEPFIKAIGGLKNLIKAQREGRPLSEALAEVEPEWQTALRELDPANPKARPEIEFDENFTVHENSVVPKRNEEFDQSGFRTSGEPGRAANDEVTSLKPRDNNDPIKEYNGIPGEVERDIGGGDSRPLNFQTEMFPEVVRREEAIHDIQLQVKGDRWIDPMTGKEKLIPMSNRAREELLATAKDPNSPVHLDKLTPETREELLRTLASDNEAARWFAPKTVRGKPFALDDARRAEFDKALETSLTVPYATLKAERPGTAIEDVLGTFFNYRYMDSPEQVKTSLAQLADVMRPMVDKHVGGFPQTFERVSELADWLGTKPDTLTAILSQQARGAEHLPAMVVAGKTWIQSLTQDIIRISKMIDSGMATDTAKIELARRKDILGDLIGTVKSVQTSAARTTAAGRIRTTAEYSHEEMQTLLKEIGEDGVKFVTRALQLSDGNPKSVIALLEPSFGQKGFGVLNETWINGLLSGAGTHIINLVTGLRNTALFPMFRGVGGLLTGDMRSVRIALGQYTAVKSTVFDSLEMARRALVTENAYLDPIYHQVERERIWIKADTFGADGTDVLGNAIDFLGHAIRMPSRFLTAEDEFMKQMTYRASVISRGKQEAIERGLKDDVMVPYFINGEKKMISQVDEYVNDRMNEAFHPKLENGLDANALKDARRATFTGPLRQANWLGARTSLGELAQNAAAQHPWFRHLVMPFVRVPTNIIREMIYESPAAPLRAQFWADVKAGGEARSDAVGRLALGTLFWGGAGMLAAEGTITGKGPSDPQLLKQLKATGWQPYSIKLPGAGPDGKDLYVSYNRFDPTAGMLGIAADFAYISAHVDERTQDQLASTLTMSLANNLNSRSYLRSLTELMAMVGQSGNPQAPALVQRWINSRASSYVPRIVSTFDTDDTLRDARTAVEAIMSKVPGLSDKLPPQRDNFGKPMMAVPGWPINEINPFAVSMGKEGAARKELAYWAESPSRTQFVMPHTTIDGVIDLRDFKNANTGQSAYDRWLEVLTEPRWNGKTVEERMDGLVKTDGYRELKRRGVEDPFYRKHPAAEMLRDQLTLHYGQAQKMMLGEPGFEDLRHALLVYENNKRTVPLGASPPPNATLEDLLLKR